MISVTPFTARLALLAVSFSVLVQPAHAHTGMADGVSFVGGLLHPFTGIDHLLVLLAVGFWASSLSTGRARAAMLAGAVAGTAAGGALGAALGGFALVAGLLFASLIAIGLLMLFSPRLPAALGGMLVLAAAALHGYPHGSEFWTAAMPGGYAAGFLLGSGAVMVAGQAVGMLARGYRPGLVQIIAAGFAAAGIVLLTG